MSSYEELISIKNRLDKILNSGKEPVYCEELITTGELQRLLEEIERLNNIINNIDKKCKYLLNNEKVIINGKEYIKQSADNIITNYIMEELKGSDKE